MAGIRSLVGNLGLIVALNLLTKPLWVILENLVQDRIGHDTWGYYGAILSFCLIIGALTELGVNQYCTKTLGAQPERHAELFPTLWGIKLLSGLAYLLLLLGGGWLMGYLADWPLLLAVGAAQWIIGLVSFYRALMQAHHHFRLDTLAGVADKTLLMLPVGTLLVTGIWLMGYVWAVLGTSLVTLLVFGGIALRRYGWQAPSFGLPQMRTILRSTLPFAPIFILFLILEKVNPILLEKAVGKAETGLYQAAFRYFSVFQMYLWTVLPIFYAKFARSHIQAPAERQRLFSAGQGIVALPMLWVCLVLWFYGDHLFLLFFRHSTPAQLAEMTASLRWLALALLFNSVFNIYSTYLTATGGERYVNFWVALAIVANVATLWLLAPHWGQQAGALSLTVGFGVMSLGFVGSYVATTGLRVPLGLLLRLLLVLALGYGLLWLMAPLHWMLSSTLAGVGILAAGLALKTLDLKMKLE